MGVEYIAFEGYEVIAEAGDEALQPRRNLPKAILYSVLIVTVTYVLVAFGLIAGVRGVEGPAWEWLAGFGEQGFGAAMAKLMPLGSYMAFLTVLFAATSALNATIFSAARVSYALGRDRMLPGVLGRISPKRSTPHVALAASGVLVVAGIFLPITDLASAASIMFLFLFLLANVLRAADALEPRRGDAVRVPHAPVPARASRGDRPAARPRHLHRERQLARLGDRPGLDCRGAADLLPLCAHKRALPIREEIFAVDAPVVPSDGRFRILVPVADADQVLPLVPTMLRLAEVSDGCVELVHLVAVPDQVPLADAHRYAMPGTEGTVEASLYLPARRLVNSSILYCRNPARGILFQAHAGRADLILLGWRGRVPEAGRLFGRTLDQVIRQATCDVAVVRPGGKAPYLNVLVPVAGGPNSERALEIAGMLADPKKGIVTALHVQSGRSQPIDVAALVTKVCRESSMSCDRFSGRVLVADDPRAVILREAAGADLIVLGATEGRFRRLIAATLPGEIARSCDRPLVIVRAMGRHRRSGAA